MTNLLAKYFNSIWLPAFVYMFLLVIFAITDTSQWWPLTVASTVLVGMVGLAFLGLIAATIWNMTKKRWHLGAIHLLSVVACSFATFIVFVYLMFATEFGPSEDGFADSLTIPDDIEIAEPDRNVSLARSGDTTNQADEFQEMVRNALATLGNDSTEIVPSIPSLRKASTDHSETFRRYIEASPDWRVFTEQGNHFAYRRWSYGGEPQDTLHGYITQFGGETGFQIRCLLCLDRKQWSRYSVQQVQEGENSVTPDMSMGNNLRESRVMIDCGGVWVELFEQSGQPERRATKAMVTALENEFSTFLRDPIAAVATAQDRSRELANRYVSEDGQPFRLVSGMQPGIYGVIYSLNPGEPGFVYLKAFEVTKGTQLSAQWVEAESKTRMTWSTDPSERFGAKGGLTIYEGDWGKPYAARFEVWFQPDSGEKERKLAERNFKIEGWQR